MTMRQDDIVKAFNQLLGDLDQDETIGVMARVTEVQAARLCHSTPLFHEYVRGRTVKE